MVEFSLKQLKIHNKVTKWQSDVLLDGTLKYEHDIVVEGAPNGSFEGTPTFEVEIKGALGVTIKLHLKMHLVMHLLV